MVAYSDLVGFSIIALVMQIISGFYVFKIRRFVGKRMYFLQGGINAVLIITDLLIVFTIALAAGRSGQQPIEFVGLLIGFILPFTSAALHLFWSYGVAKGLLGAMSSDTYLTKTARDIDRDEKRDIKRDVDRDSDRDIDRDVGRDIDRDVGRDLKRDAPRDIDRDIEKDKQDK